MDLDLAPAGGAPACLQNVLGQSRELLEIAVRLRVAPHAQELVLDVPALVRELHLGGDVDRRIIELLLDLNRIRASQGPEDGS